MAAMVAAQLPEGVCGLTREPLNFGLVIFAPVSSVPGSASVFYLQPLLTSKVVAASGVLIGAELFLLLAQKLFGLEGVPVLRGNAEDGLERVTIPVAELRDFLQAIAGREWVTLGAGNGQQAGNGFQSGSFSEFLTPTTPEAPLIFGLAVYGDYSSVQFSPLLFFTVPIFTLPGVRGGLPILILCTLTTIFVRCVVPPSTTGARPLTQQRTGPLPFRTEEFLNFLQRFGKYFAK